MHADKGVGCFAGKGVRCCCCVCADKGVKCFCCVCVCADKGVRCFCCVYPNSVFCFLVCVCVQTWVQSVFNVCVVRV